MTEKDSHINELATERIEMLTEHTHIMAIYHRHESSYHWRICWSPAVPKHIKIWHEAACRMHDLAKLLYKQNNVEEAEYYGGIADELSGRVELITMNKED